jgi:DNA-binding NarL/FixJ family response regulator
MPMIFLFLKHIFEKLKVSNEIKIFSTSESLFDYLLETTDLPSLIISDINLGKIDGIRLKEMINENDYLIKKSIPYIFLSTTQDLHTVNSLWMIVQGFLLKRMTSIGQ